MKPKTYNIKNKEVEQVINSYSSEVKSEILSLRELIFETALEDTRIGEIEETLRWGEPTYLTKSKSGTMIRIAQKDPNTYAIYVHCQTSLIETFREMFPKLTFEGNRAIVFDVKDNIPKKEIKQCFLYALTYNLK